MHAPAARHVGQPRLVRCSSEIGLALGSLPFNTYLGEALWTIDGLDAGGYGRLIHPFTLLTAAARADLRRVARQCAGQTIADWRGKQASAVFARNPLAMPSVVKLLKQISPGQRDPKVPIGAPAHRRLISSR
jgi:hypothetical protein